MFTSRTHPATHFPDNPKAGKLLIFQFSLLLLIAVSISSCSSTEPITVPIFSSRLDSPEMSTRTTEVVIGGSIIDHNEIILVPDAVVDPPDFDDPSLTRDERLPTPSAHIGVTLLNHIEVSFDTDRGLQFRSQLFGENRKNAHEGNSSAALSVGFHYTVGGGEEKVSNSPYSDITLAEYDWQVTTYYSNFLVGYRPHENILIYGGPYYTAYSLSGTLEQFAYRDRIAQDQEFALQGSGYQTGLGVAAEFIFDAHIAKQALVYTLRVGKTSWDNYTSSITFNHGFMVKYYF